jgi:hypothetical protein
MLKSKMIRPNHAKKCYDFNKKIARGNAQDKELCFLTKKKQHAAALKTKNIVYCIKALAATFNTQKNVLLHRYRCKM